MKPLILFTPDIQSILSSNKVRHSVPVKRPKNVPQDYILKPEAIEDSWTVWWQDPAYKNLGMSSDAPFGSPGDQEWQTGMPPEDKMYWVDDQEMPLHYCQTIAKRPARWKRMGTVLYVKETFTVLEPEHCASMDERFVYKQKCSAESEEIRKEYVECGWPYTWKSPVRMPREAARIFLEVTNVTCKRVQDITEEEAKEHGVEMIDLLNDGAHYHFKDYTGKEKGLVTPRLSFQSLWAFRHGPDSWNNNDFVFSANWEVLSVNGKPSYL